MNACELIQRIDTLIRGVVSQASAKTAAPSTVDRKGESHLTNPGLGNEIQRPNSTDISSDS